MTRRWSLRLAAALLAGAFLLSGCADKQEASDSLPSATAAPTEETLPPLGPEDLPMPADARTPDAAGAEAFVRYYIDLINRTSDVMDAAPLREFSDGCRDCTRVATSVDDAAAVGHDFEGGQITIRELGRPLIEEGDAEFALIVDQAEFVVLDETGTPTEGGFQAFSAIRGGAALSWDESRLSWTVTDLTFG